MPAVDGAKLVGGMKMEALITDGLIDGVRQKFWYAVEDRSGAQRIFFDSAAGSLVLKEAHSAIERYSRISSYGGGLFSDSVVVDELVERARESVAMLVNAPSSKHIITAESTTAMFRRLAEAILPSLPDNSRIVVSAADHNANIDAWRRTAAELSHKQLDVQMVRFDPTTGTVDLNHLETLADDRVRLMAVSHASNALGAENPIRQVRELLNRTAPDALLIVDGVHFIPHGLVDVEAMGADAYAFSSYKIFAQRGLSFAYGSDKLLRLPHYKLAPAPELPPESWDLGFRNPADFAPIIETANYLAWLGGECFPATSPEVKRDTARLVKLGQVAIRQYENRLVRAMFDGVGTTPGLRAIDGVTIYGLHEPEYYHLKEPTFSFNLRGQACDDVALTLWQKHRIAVRSGDHYAMDTHKHLGIPGSVRASLAHYNTVDEVKTFLETLSQVAKAG
jgi:selenocysteine lyase/cysteine desulfurase